MVRRLFTFLIYFNLINISFAATSPNPWSDSISAFTLDEDCSISYPGSMQNALGDLSSSLVANDFEVAGNTTMTVNQLTVNIFRNVSTITVKLYQDNGGVPGDLIVSFDGLTPTSQTFIGATAYHNVYENVVDFPESVELGGGESGRIFWIALGTTLGSEGTGNYWEEADATTNQLAMQSWDNGASWSVNYFNQDSAFTISGVCVGDGGGGSEPENGCLSAPNGQWPNEIIEPTCAGVPVGMTYLQGWTGEYSLVQVTAGTEYTFSSSNPSNYITIGSEYGTHVLAYGTGEVVWTATEDTNVRFYTHIDEDCTWNTDVYIDRQTVSKLLAFS